jgi:hypothetical protein
MRRAHWLLGTTLQRVEPAPTKGQCTQPHPPVVWYTLRYSPLNLFQATGDAVNRSGEGSGTMQRNLTIGSHDT